MSNINLIENYVYTKKLNLDLAQLVNSTNEFYKIIEDKFLSGEKNYSDTAAPSTQVYYLYNMLLYPFPGFHQLYKEIQTMLYECIAKENTDAPTEQYYLECWLNVYHKDEYITWHPHWKPEYKTWFGFFCVNCKDSKTTFDIPGVEGYTDITDIDNLLVMARSNGDVHRTWPWPHNDQTRITIGYNIVPYQMIPMHETLNHWIPI